MRKPPFQSDDERRAGRDEALDALQETRKFLIQTGYKIAINHCARKGVVCSNDVWKVLWKRAGEDKDLESKLLFCDERWMGAVFARGRGWKFVKWIEEGSHKRPIQVWTKGRKKAGRKRGGNGAGS